jgi:hypothetical protein
LVNEDGDPVELDLAPALRETEIKALEADIGLALPSELRQVLRHTGGIDGIEPIDFTGRESFEMDWIFPSGFPIAADGFGNFWVVDLVPGETEAAPVFYASHDPPVILYQSPNIAHYLRETFRLYAPPHTSLVDDVHEDRPFDVWRKNPGTIDQPTALASEDELLRDFAGTLDERFSLVDLRRRRSGWVSRGADTATAQRSGDTATNVSSPTGGHRRNPACCAGCWTSRLLCATKSTPSRAFSGSSFSTARARFGLAAPAEQWLDQDLGEVPVGGRGRGESFRLRLYVYVDATYRRQGTDHSHDCYRGKLRPRARGAREGARGPVR